MKFLFNFLGGILFNFLIFSYQPSIAKEDNYKCQPKHAAAIRSDGIKIFKITGKEKSIIVSIKDGFFKTNDMNYKLYEAGGRAFAFNEKRSWNDIPAADKEEAMKMGNKMGEVACKILDDSKKWF